MSTPPDTVSAFKLVYGFAAFQTLHACIELGVFERLRGGSATAEAIGEGMTPGGAQLRSLLCSACSFDLLSRNEGKYRNTALTEKFFTRESPDSLLAFVKSAQMLQYKGFFHTAEAVRSGTNAGLSEYGSGSGTLYELMSSDPVLEDTLYEVMARIWDFCSGGLRDVPELTAVRHLLDVAGGSGHVAHLLTDFYPDLRVTVFDRATTCKRVELRARESGRSSRIDATPGDVTKDALPKVADAVMFAHCLEWLNPDEVIQLLKRAFDALPSGGRVFCYQFAVNDSETGGVYSARLSLYFNIVETGKGYAYPASELESFYRAAGFVNIRSNDGPFEHVLVVGEKP